MVKRNKRSRLRGKRTCGRGSRKKGRGSGERGGVGMAGSGKKAGQKIVLLKKNFPNYLGKKGFRSLKQKKGIKIKTINLKDIMKMLNKFEKEGKLKGNELNLEGYKILGEGELNKKLTIKASEFSLSSKEKIEKAGGNAILLNKK